MASVEIPLRVLAGEGTARRVVGIRDGVLVVPRRGAGQTEGELRPSVVCWRNRSASDVGVTIRARRCAHEKLLRRSRDRPAAVDAALGS